MSAPPLTLVVRADATARIGAGHVMRCLALAASWRSRHGSVSLWGEVSLPFVRRRVDETAIAVDGGHPGGADVLVVDSYDERERESGATDGVFGVRVIVDDFGEGVPAGYDAVWNPAPTADARMYASFPGTVLAGAEFVPLRQPLPTWRRTASDAPTAAVMLGGTTIAGELAATLSEGARRAAGWQFVVLGDWSPDAWPQLDPDDPWSGASSCDCLVTAAGTTMLEAAAVGIPVVVLQTADNQAANARWARDAGAPTIDLTRPDAVRSIAEWLPAALAAARPLPPLRDGSSAVAATLASLAQRRRMASVER